MHPDQTPNEPARPTDGLDKQEARRVAFAARDALPQAERERLGEAVLAHALDLPELAAAATVMLFASFRSEIDTAPLAEWVLRTGRTLCLPRILGPRRMAAFRVRDRASDLAPGKWDIPEPREGLTEVPPEAVDLVFVPGSAFDEGGRRCGYGGGFYDNFLPRTRPGTPWVALAFEAQLLPRIHVEAHDLPVTTIVTERRVIRPG
jgi:5-formyltetrahydrofolate cyclo-ligase